MTTEKLIKATKLNDKINSLERQKTFFEFLTLKPDAEIKLQIEGGAPIVISDYVAVSQIISQIKQTINSRVQDLKNEFETL